MNILDVVLHSLRTIKKNPKFLFPALLFVLFVIVVLRVVLATTRTIPIVVLAAVIVFLAGIVVKGTYIDLCHNSKKFPKKPSIRKSFKVATERYKDLLVFEVIALAAELVIAAIILLPLIYVAQSSIIYPYLNNIVISGSSFLGFSIIMTVLTVVYVILAVAVAILLLLGPSIVVLDHSDAISALKESIRIGKREPLRILGVLVVSCLLVVIALLISRAFQLIPYVGVIISFIITIGIVTFIAIIAPTYYLTYHKK